MAVRPEIDAAVGGIPVRIVELSVVGARLEHEERFSLAAPQLQLIGIGPAVTLPLRVIRTEIVGRSGAKLMYGTGVEFTGDRSTIETMLSPILRSVMPDSSKDDPPAPAAPKQPADVPPPPVPEPEPVLAGVSAPNASPAVAPAPARHSLDDTWTRRVNFLGVDPEDTLPYAQFRRSGDRWTKTYVATADQPEDGFTIPRDEPDLIELQRTFEYADAETQQMMRIALKAKLERSAR